MQQLRARCKELKVNPCSGSGMTADVLLAKINAEERRLGVPLTLITVKKQSKPVETPLSNIDAEEIRRTNRALYDVLQPLFDQGIVPSGHLFDDAEVAGRWKDDNTAILHDPWHALLSQLSELGMEGKLYEDDRRRFEMINKNDDDRHRWFFESTEALRSFVNRYDLILWGDYLGSRRTNGGSKKRRMLLERLFIGAGRLDLMEPITQVTKEMIEEIRDAETAQELYAIDPSVPISVFERYWNLPIGAIFWEMESGQLTQDKVRTYMNRHSIIGEERTEELLITLLDRNYLQPSPGLMAASVVYPRLFEQLLKDPRATMTINDAPLIARHTFDIRKNLGINRDSERASDEIFGRITRLIDTFSLDLTKLNRYHVVNLFNDHLLAPFLAYQAFRQHIDKEHLFRYIHIRNVKESFNHLVQSDKYKLLSPVALNDILLSVITTGTGKDVDFMTERYSFSYTDLLDYFVDSPRIVHIMTSSFRKGLSAMEGTPNNELIAHLLNVDYQNYSDSRDETIRVLIDREVYDQSLNGIRRLIYVYFAQQRDLQLYLLTKRKVKEILGEEMIKTIKSDLVKQK